MAIFVHDRGLAMHETARTRAPDSRDLGKALKFTQTDVSPSFDRFMPQIGCTVGLQLVSTPGIWRVIQRDGFRVIVASAAEALACLV